jgi:hypothetical protein
MVAFVALGCMAADEDIPAAAVPTTTGIPIGAPGAVGARVEPPAPPAILRAPRSNGIEQKINPDPLPEPGHEPIIPPSPFGSPQDDGPAVTTKKKPKGTKI